MSTKESFIEAYVHHGRVGVLVELSMDDSFTPQTEAFKQLAKDLAMQIAATNPQDLDALFQQPFVKDAFVSVAHHISRISKELHEHLTITRFARWDTEYQPPAAPPTPPDKPAVALRLKKVK